MTSSTQSPLSYGGRWQGPRVKGTHELWAYDQNGTQSGHDSLTSATVAHEPGETKRSPLSSSEWFMMKMTTRWILLEDRRLAISFIVCPWLMTCSRVSKLKVISS